LHDVIEVTDYFNSIPCITFVGKDNVISDLVGEKLHLMHSTEIIKQVRKKYDSIQFAFIAPDVNEQTYRYILFVQFSEPATGIFKDLLCSIEEDLSKNYHYRHALRLKQLEPLRIFMITEDAERRYIEHCEQKGIKRGDNKIQSLQKETDWRFVFKGELT
jgi:hypothetical protein